MNLGLPTGSPDFQTKSEELLKRLENSVPKTSSKNIANTSNSVSLGAIDSNLSEDIKSLFDSFANATPEDKEKNYKHLQPLTVKLENIKLSPKLIYLIHIFQKTSMKPPSHYNPVKKDKAGANKNQKAEAAIQEPEDKEQNLVDRSKEEKEEVTNLEDFNELNFDLSDTNDLLNNLNTLENPELENPESDQVGTKQPSQQEIIEEIKKSPFYAGEIDQEEAQTRLKNQVGWLIRFDTDEKRMYLSYNEQANSNKPPDEVAVTSLDHAMSFAEDMELNILKATEPGQVDIKEEEEISTLETSLEKELNLPLGEMDDLLKGLNALENPESGQVATKQPPQQEKTKAKTKYNSLIGKNVGEKGYRRKGEVAHEPTKSSEVNPEKIKQIESSPFYVGNIDKETAKAVLGNNMGWLYRFDEKEKAMYLSFNEVGRGFGEFEVSTLENAMTSLLEANNFIKLMKMGMEPEEIKNERVLDFKKKQQLPKD